MQKTEHDGWELFGNIIIDVDVVVRDVDGAG